MRVDIKKLKDVIAEKNISQDAVAGAIKIDRSTFYRKLNGEGRPFTIGEVHSMVKAIPLTDDEAVQIFLAK